MTFSLSGMHQKSVALWSGLLRLQSFINCLPVSHSPLIRSTRLGSPAIFINIGAW
jgi:hypothetical protein